MDTEAAEFTGSGRRAAGAAREAAGKSRTSSAVIKLRLVFNDLLTKADLPEWQRWRLQPRLQADDSRIAGKWLPARRARRWFRRIALSGWH
jgi:hypothetical protein